MGSDRAFLFGQRAVARRLVENENGWVGPPPYELADDEMANRFAGLANKDAAEGTKLLALYKRLHPQTRNQMLWLMAEADEQRRWSAQELCRLKAEQGSAASYLYFFDWQSPVHNDRMGSYHTLDIPFVFYNMDLGASMTGSAQARLSARARDERGMGRVRAHGQSEPRGHAQLAEFRREQLSDDGVRRSRARRERSEQGRAPSARRAASEAAVVKQGGVSSCRGFRRASAMGLRPCRSQFTTNSHAPIASSTPRSCIAADRARTTATRDRRTRCSQDRADRRRAIVIVLDGPAAQHEHSDVHDRENAHKQQRGRAAERAHTPPARERQREHRRERRCRPMACGVRECTAANTGGTTCSRAMP
jgi:hypothetical protein